MRNSKNLFSLFLALVMIASFMTIPAFADTGTETAKITSVTFSDPSVTVVSSNEASQTSITVCVSLDSDGQPADDDAYNATGTLSSGTSIIDVSSLVASITSVAAAGDYYAYARATDESTSDWVKGDKIVTVEEDEDVDPSPSPSPEIPNASPTDFSHNINYPETGAVSPYLIKATPAKDSVTDDTVTYAPDSAVIDLAAETLTLPEGFTAAAYSLDGGGKWSNKSLPAGDISKLLSKGMTLWLSNKASEKATKKPPVGKAAVGTEGADGYEAAVNGATLIKFAAIEARPKDGKLAVNYGLYPATFGTTGQWILAAKDATTVDSAAIASLQIAVAGSDKKKADEAGWGTFKTGEGINVKPLPDSGKPEKTIYLIRIAPVVGATNTPASKGYKVTASSQIAAPKLKADYKKEIIKSKADIQIAKTTGTVTDGKIASITAITDTTGDNAIVTFSKENSAAIKAGYDISGILKEEETAVMVQQKGTSKKPASGVQTIILAPRAKLADVTLSPTKGKLKLDKTYEVYDSTKGKYAGLPKIAGAAAAGIKDVRMKATAKADKSGGYSGTAASKGGMIFYTWDVIDPAAKTPKSGVTAATLIGPDYKDGKFVLYASSDNDLVLDDADGEVDLMFGVKNALYTADGELATDPEAFTVTYGESTVSSLKLVLGSTVYNGLTLPDLTLQNVPAGKVEISNGLTGTAKIVYWSGEVKVVEVSDSEVVAKVKSELTASALTVTETDPATLTATATALAAVKAKADTINASRTTLITAMDTAADNFQALNGSTSGFVQVKFTITKGEASDTSIVKVPITEANAGPSIANASTAVAASATANWTVNLGSGEHKAASITGITVEVPADSGITVSLTAEGSATATPAANKYSLNTNGKLYINCGAGSGFTKNGEYILTVTFDDDTTVDIKVKVVPTVTNVAVGNVNTNDGTLTLTLNDPTGVALKGVTISEMATSLTSLDLDAIFKVGTATSIFIGGGTAKLNGNDLVITITAKALSTSTTVGSSSAPLTFEFKPGALSYNNADIDIGKSLTIWQAMGMSTGKINIGIAVES